MSAKVAIMMGSANDKSVMEGASGILEEFGIEYEMKVLSAHRTPKETAEYAETFRSKGGKVFICGAGGSAALAGVVSAHTTLPVFGVPIDSMGLGGLDALLSTVQMPPGIPVGGVAIGKAGAKNAALLAIRTMAVDDDVLTQKLDDYRQAAADKILNAN